MVSREFKSNREKGEHYVQKDLRMELAGRTLRVDVDRVAKQANGAVLMHYGDTTCSVYGNCI